MSNTTFGAAAATVGNTGKSQSLCFQCGEPGHIRRNCPKRERNSASGRAGSNNGQASTSTSGKHTSASHTVVCYFCDGKGHVKKDCEARKAWLQSSGGKAAATASSTEEKRDKCLCIAGSVPGNLPRVFADVEAPGSSAYRVRAVLDTGSTRTLLSQSVMAQLNLAGSLESLPGGGGIVALDGQPLDVLGAVEVQVSRADGPVQIPPTSVKVLVLPDLSVVNAEMLIGSDFVAMCGGLHLQYDCNGDLTGATLGSRDRLEPTQPVTACTSDRPVDKLSRHVSVTRDGDDILLATDDGEVQWVASEQRWIVTWKWLDGHEPVSPVGSGIGEYPRSNLTPDQEEMYLAAVDEWIANGWLVPHDPDVHGQPACVLPLIPKTQEHKLSTPVRPVLDYRELNKLLVSRPGRQAPVCTETLRKWRVKGGTEYDLLDISKAYLQVHVHPDLARYQTVVWRDKVFVMTRMGFGLSIAPKVMDMIVKCVTNDLPEVDNYVDDLMVPRSQQQFVTERLALYGLPTKPAEPLSVARVLGLQLKELPDGSAAWSRRELDQRLIPEVLTKRSLFQWCGKLTGHYPVASWLRVHCGWLKRIACLEGTGWDSPLSESLVQLCSDLDKKLCGGDPVKGVWHVSEADDSPWTVWCDASDIAVGVALERHGNIVEDCSWLRERGDKRHINVAELEAALKGLTLAAEWSVRKLRLVTDSRTVAGWLRQVVNNMQRTKTKGLHEVLVQRRLQVVDDLIAITGLTVEVVWVPSEENRADVLTRVLQDWIKYAKSLEPVDTVAAACLSVVGPVTLEQIGREQKACAEISNAIAQLEAGNSVTSPQFQKVTRQLSVENGVLYRNVKLPIEGEVSVPVIPESLQEEVVSAVHLNTGHASWQTMFDVLRSKCYFPLMQTQCQQLVAKCQSCQCASSKRGPHADPTHPDIPGKPWSELVLDTLELGLDRRGDHHCVLVIIDTFTKWASAVPKGMATSRSGSTSI